MSKSTDQISDIRHGISATGQQTTDVSNLKSPISDLKSIYHFTLLILALLTASCSGTRKLKPGEILYTGATIKLNPDTPAVKDQKNFQNDLEEKVRPVPNKKILGWRYKLFFYNLVSEPKKQKGFKYWIKYKLGEPPVLMSQVRLQNNVNVMSSYLASKGFLQSSGTGDTVIKGKTGKAFYRIYSGPRYTMNAISFPADSNEISALIRASQNKTLLKQGHYYDLDVFKAERERIDIQLKEKGYFYFNPNFLLIQADSTIGGNQVDIDLKLKNDAPRAALQPYFIRNIHIYPDYSLRRDSFTRASEPVQFKDFTIYDPNHKYKPRLFEHLIFFQKGERYNRTDHSLSLNRLVNIGTFRFVKAEFNPIDTASSNNMDVDFLLTSSKKNALSLSVTGTSKSNNFIGSEIKVTHTNKNAFRGAEQLNLSLSGGFEKQFSGQQKNLTSYSLGAEARLLFPRFLIPVAGFTTHNAYVPKTHITIGSQLLNRANYYTLLSGKGEFGYLWKGNEYNEHQFNPLSVSYIRTANTTDSFNRMLEKVPTLKNNFENQFIIGTNYTYTYSNQVKNELRNNFLFMGSVESAGNLINAFLRKDEDGRKRLFQTVTNQFVRLEADFRDYYKINSSLIWANRLNLGYGIPYGNSSVLPYVRQFFAGGSNDIRAFRSRSLGPGTFYINTDSLDLFADQGGDVKLMLNTELRAKLFSVIQGAVFIDAGNIWLAKKDTSRPGGQFRFGNVLSQTAVGGGVGLRVDASIFVVRFDLAMPFRKPWLPPGERWVFDQIRFGDPEWRKKNLIFNIGIGYPF
ncbi:BamA/TamA family outer membrane protein [Niabella sp. CC-SYL272]|uniref:translocation and assembly module lipoprotein TamL n=1 Tax=Niabella agricola TaxID=2891571 RepID=UPI001F3B338F|nr:BamA/TamA family outer membrane protein [Niabella agricola]MCF3111988.1 BamA/TamA family outer membrane protein [Niabella agricola]